MHAGKTRMPSLLIAAMLVCSCALPVRPAWDPEPAPVVVEPDPQRAEPIWDRSAWEGVFKPAAALERERRVPWRADARGYAARFEVDGRALTWRVDPREGFPLRLLSIEEQGTRVVPCSNAYQSPPAPPGKPRKTELDDGRLVLEYDSGLRARYEVLGAAVLVELEGPREGGHEEFELSLGGLVRGPGVTRMSAHTAYGCDDAAVACLGLQRGGARFLSVRVDPTWSNASLIVPRRPGASGPDGEFLHSQILRYEADTRGRVRPLYERVWIAWSGELLDVLPALERPASPGRAQAIRGYLSLHLPDFALSERVLREVSALGVRDVAVWMHKWQRDGYDRGYPSAVFPPNPEWGGLDGLRAVREAARKAGFPFALHHNWMFNGERLPGGSVLDSDSIPRGSGDGGEFLKPRVALKLVERVEGEFHAALQTEGTFTDSLTTGLPAVDLDAREPGVGLLLPALQRLSEVVARLRAIHGAPVAGEGSVGFGNLLWAGQVDALNGYAGMFTDPADRETLGRFAELAPDFNLWRLRPLSVRVGVGEPPRFLDPFGEMRLAYEPEQRDQKLSTTALLGNASYFWFVPGCNAHEAARDWWASDAAARRMLDPARRPLRVEYADPRGGRRGTLSQHLAAGGGLHMGDLRARIDYSDGLSTWVNLTDLPWALDEREPGLGGRSDIVLAPWGRYVVDAGFECGLLQVAGQRVEFACSIEQAFIDGRGEPVERAGLATDGACAVRRGPGGVLDVFPLREFRTRIAADGSETRVLTRRVRIARTWFDTGVDAVEVEFRDTGPATLASSTLALDETGLELDVDALAQAGGLWIRLRSAR